MSLRIKYFLFIGIIHFVIALLSFYLLEERKLLFLLAEFGILISLFFSYMLYKSLIRPLEFMYSGIDAIQDQDFNIKFVKTGSKEMDKLIDVYNAMIDNIRTERIQVQEQHFFLKKLINASPTCIIILDYDGKITDINPLALKIFNLKENTFKKTFAEINHPVLNQIDDIKIGSSAVISTNGFDKYKCQVSQFIHRGFHRKFILVQELSKEILAAEKKAYEKVIRMMAHEVNNSIGAINSILNSLVEFYNTDDEDWIDSLKIAIDRNDRMNLFMKNFATVVRLPEPSFEKTDLNLLVEGIGKLMQSQAAAQNVDISFQLDNQPIFAPLDVKQMEQALVNIIKNALESIENTGEIQLITTDHPKTIIVRDNGAGIDPEVANKLFTPFFSTKMTGQGIGLTLIKEILLNHNAEFFLQTVEDGWTEFRIVFK